MLNKASLKPQIKAAVKRAMVRYRITGFEESPIEVLFFRSVTNAVGILEFVRSGQFEAAWLSCNCVLDPLQLLAAANTALIASAGGKMRTRNVHSELVLNLSATTNISASFKKFGIHPESTSIIVALFNPTEERVKTVTDLVQGELIHALEAKEAADLENIRKTYKIDTKEESVTSLLDAIIHRIAVRDYA